MPDEFKLPANMNVQQQLDYLMNYVRHREHEIASLKEQIASLKEPTPEETAAEKKERRAEEREERSQARAEESSRRARAELDRARADAIRAISKLLPEAIRQAKAKPPKVALLRMILRATK